MVLPEEGDLLLVSSLGVCEPVKRKVELLSGVAEFVVHGDVGGDLGPFLGSRHASLSGRRLADQGLADGVPGLNKGLVKLTK